MPEDSLNITGVRAIDTDMTYNPHCPIGTLAEDLYRFMPKIIINGKPLAELIADELNQEDEEQQRDLEDVLYVLEQEAESADTERYDELRQLADEIAAAPQHLQDPVYQVQYYKRALDSMNNATSLKWLYKGKMSIAEAVDRVLYHHLLTDEQRLESPVRDTSYESMRDTPYLIALRGYLMQSCLVTRWRTVFVKRLDDQGLKLLKSTKFADETLSLTLKPDGIDVVQDFEQYGSLFEEVDREMVLKANASQRKRDKPFFTGKSQHQLIASAGTKTYTCRLVDAEAHSEREDVARFLKNETREEIIRRTQRELEQVLLTEPSREEKEKYQWELDLFKALSAYSAQATENTFYNIIAILLNNRAFYDRIVPPQFDLLDIISRYQGFSPGIQQTLLDLLPRLAHWDVYGAPEVINLHYQRFNSPVVEDRDLFESLHQHTIQFYRNKSSLQIFKQGSTTHFIELAKVFKQDRFVRRLRQDFLQWLKSELEPLFIKGAPHSRKMAHIEKAFAGRRGDKQNIISHLLELSNSGYIYLVLIKQIKTYEIRQKVSLAGADSMAQMARMDASFLRNALPEINFELQVLAAITKYLITPLQRVASNDFLSRLRDNLPAYSQSLRLGTIDLIVKTMLIKPLTHCKQAELWLLLIERNHLLQVPRAVQEALACIAAGPPEHAYADVGDVCDKVLLAIKACAGREGLQDMLDFLDEIYRYQLVKQYPLLAEDPPTKPGFSQQFGSYVSNKSQSRKKEDLTKVEVMRAARAFYIGEHPQIEDYLAVVLPVKDIAFYFKWQGKSTVLETHRTVLIEWLTQQGVHPLIKPLRLYLSKEQPKGIDAQTLAEEINAYVDGDIEASTLNQTLLDILQSLPTWERVKDLPAAIERFRVKLPQPQDELLAVEMHDVPSHKRTQD